MKNFAIYILILTTLTACTTSPASPRLPESTSTQSPVPATTTTATIETAATPTSIDHLPDGKILIVDQTDYYLANPDGSEQSLIYADEQGQVGMASLSPDTTKFAYFLNNVVYIQDVKTGKTVTLSKEDIGPAGGQEIRWSPDGAKLALTCSIERQPFGGICLIDSQTGQIEVLLNEKNTDAFCSGGLFPLLDWSQDGATLVYECFFIVEKGQKPIFSVYFYDFASKTSRKVFDAGTQDTIWGISSVSISPDNHLLLIAGHRQDDPGQVFCLNLSDNALKQLTNETGYYSSALVWRNDSKTFYLHKTSIETPYPESNFIMNINGEIVSPVKIEGTIIK